MLTLRMHDIHVGALVELNRDAIGYVVMVEDQLVQLTCIGRLPCRRVKLWF